MIKFTAPDENDSFARIALEGKEYLFRFSYNYMAKFWTIGIYKDKDTPIVAGIKLVPRFPLNFCFYQYEDLPKGLLFVKTHKERIQRSDFKKKNAEFLYLSTDDAKKYGLV